MKNVVEVKKKERIVFTEKEDDSRIKKNYNHLEVNCKSIYKKGVDCINMRNLILKEIREKMDFKGRVVSYIFPKTCVKIYGLASKKATNNILA